MGVWSANPPNFKNFENSYQITIKRFAQFFIIENIKLEGKLGSG